MYNISYFKAADGDELLLFMQAHPFVTICGISEDGTPAASHIPVLIENRAGKIFLLAHIMRKQDHTNAFKLSQNRSEKDYDNIIDQLKKRDPDSKQVAEIMYARRDRVFIDNPSA
jgi:predicted FMN-binding regulatory protein PaiB